jgi:hypothetical protein
MQADATTYNIITRKGLKNDWKSVTRQQKIGQVVFWMSYC